MSKKKSLIKLFFVFFLFVLAGNYAFSADSSESCSSSYYDMLQYKPDGTCGTKQRTCCSSSGKWSNWGEDCTCGKNECYITYSKQCVERCTEGYTEAKSSKCNYHGTYRVGCGTGPSSGCKTFLVSSTPCKCDEGYTGTYCDKKAVDFEVVTKNAAVQSTVSGGMYSMWAFVCDTLNKTQVPTYPQGNYTITYSCGAGNDYSFGSSRYSNSSSAVNDLKNRLCNVSSSQYKSLCEEKGESYHCVIDFARLGWDTSGTGGYYETTATVLKCKAAI